MAEWEQGLAYFPRVLEEVCAVHFFIHEAPTYVTDSFFCNSCVTKGYIPQVESIDYSLQISP